MRAVRPLLACITLAAAFACSAAAFCRARSRTSASRFSRAAFSAMTFASSVCTNETALADAASGCR